jgi:deoxyinosine 3'endonuclease (endonuclease V)
MPRPQVEDEIQEKWAQEQEELKKQLILHDCYTWKLPSGEVIGSGSVEEDLKYLGGVDISFIKDNDVDACASLVVLSYPSMQVVYERYEMVKLTLPYVSGFLAFREVSFLVNLIDELKATNPTLVPQIIFVDGNGILHPRGFGLASHLGVLTGIPTLGAGKTFLFVDGLNVKDIKKEVAEKCTKGGDYVELVGKSGTIWGAALRSHDESTNPIFISQGHKMSLQTTMNIVRTCTKQRVPEPIRQADLRSRAYLRENPL